MFFRYLFICRRAGWGFSLICGLSQDKCQLKLGTYHWEGHQVFPIFDLLVSYLWLTHGLLVTYLWVTCGLLMGYLWHTFGLLGTYLGLLGTYLWSTSVLLGTHLGLPWNLLVEQLCLTIGTHLRLTWDSLSTLLGFFWNLPGTHLWVTCGLVVCFHEAYLCFLWLACALEKEINPSKS